MVKKTIKKKYTPNSKEKYMCSKHKKFFTEKLLEWRKEIIKSNNESAALSNLDDNSSSADIVDQASSYTEKTVEMRASNRRRKLVNKIDSALRRLKDNTYGYCVETGEPIGLKRLIARPIATFPWLARHEWHDIGLKSYKNLSRWYEEISKRRAVIKGFDLLKRDETIPKI